LRAALKQNVGRGVAPGHETPGTAILRQGAGYLVVHEPDPERAPLPLRAP